MSAAAAFCPTKIELFSEKLKNDTFLPFRMKEAV